METCGASCSPPLGGPCMCRDPKPQLSESARTGSVARYSAINFGGAKIAGRSGLADLLRAWYGESGPSDGLEAAACEEGFEVGFAAAEGAEEIHRLDAAAAGEEGLAEVIAVGAGEPTVLFEPLDAVGVQHFAPDI